MIILNVESSWWGVCGPLRPLLPMVGPNPLSAFSTFYVIRMRIPDMIILIMVPMMMLVMIFVMMTPVNPSPLSFRPQLWWWRNWSDHGHCRIVNSVERLNGTLEIAWLPSFTQIQFWQYPVSRRLHVEGEQHNPVFLWQLDRDDPLVQGR